MKYKMMYIDDVTGKIEDFNLSSCFKEPIPTKYFYIHDVKLI